MLISKISIAGGGEKKIEKERGREREKRGVKENQEEFLCYMNAKSCSRTYSTF